MVSTPPSQNGNCSVTSSGLAISVECRFILRFQVTVQINDIHLVNVLHASTSMDQQPEATLQVPEIGEYLVTVLPFEKESGIMLGMALPYLHNVTEGNISDYDHCIIRVT